MIIKRMLRTGSAGVRIKAFSPKNTVFNEDLSKTSAFDLILNDMEIDEEEPIIDVPPDVLRGGYQTKRSNELLFSPNTDFYQSEHVRLRIMGRDKQTNKYSVDLFRPVDILNTNFINSLRKRNEVFASAPRQFVRYLFLTDLLGRSTFREIVMRMALYKRPWNPIGEYKHSVGGFNRHYYYTKNYRLYIDYNKPGEDVDEGKILDLNVGSKHRRIFPTFTHLGFKLLENESNMMELSKRIIDVCSHSDRLVSNKPNTEILQQSLLEFKQCVNPALIQNSNYLTINNTILASTKRPYILPKFKQRLPPLLRLNNPSQTAFLLKLSFIDRNFTKWHIQTKLRLFKAASYLEKLGDMILKRLVVEYLIQLLDRKPNYVGSTTDFYFLISNPLFGRLAIIYNLHKGLISPEHQEQFEDNLNSFQDSNRISKIYRRYEVCGDLFERLVAVYYLDNENQCRDWVFKVLDNICDELMVNEKGFLVLDKQRYINELVTDGRM